MKGYYIEPTDGNWQSVFPSKESDKSQLHSCVIDALYYMVEECNVDSSKIFVIHENVTVYRDFNMTDAFKPIFGLMKGFKVEVNLKTKKARVHADHHIYDRAKSRLAKLHLVGGSYGAKKIDYFMLRVNGQDVFFKLPKLTK